MAIDASAKRNVTASWRKTTPPSFRWLDKLRYLLYEGGITQNDAKQFRGLKGVLLQSKPADNGKSRNPYIAALQ